MHRMNLLHKGTILSYTPSYFGMSNHEMSKNYIGCQDGAFWACCNPLFLFWLMRLLGLCYKIFYCDWFDLDLTTPIAMFFLFQVCYGLP